MTDETIASLHALMVESDRRYTQHFAILDMLREEMDKRYQQRFDAQQQALQDALVAQEKAVTAALMAADRAVVKAETASEKRFDGVNEFRGAMADLQSGLMPRSEAEQRIAALAEKFDDLADRVNRSEGKGSGVAASWAVGVAAVFVLLAIAGFFVTLLRP